MSLRPAILGGALPRNLYSPAAAFPSACASEAKGTQPAAAQASKAPERRGLPCGRLAPFAAWPRNALGLRGGRVARSFLRSERGAVTIEFVVLFPVLVLIILFIAWASAAISRASNIQEIAHDLARASLRHSAVTTPATLCAKLQADELEPAIKRSGETLPVSRFTFTCTARSNAPVLGLTRVEIALSYNAAGDAIADLGRGFGLNIAKIERRSVMIY